MKNQRGFTLIELLVVIAIIGILSAVVLASLSTARSKGSDAAIQSDLATIQVQSEIYYSNGNSYGGTASNGGNTCPATAGTLWNDNNIKSAVLAATNESAADFISCNSTASAYAVQARLNAPVTGFPYWCVDSTGRARATAAQLTGGVTACPL